jgi:hypothetical protein
VPTLTDINQTIRPPKGFEFIGAYAEGAFVRLLYRQLEFREGEEQPFREKTVTIFGNDFGREVYRVESNVELKVTSPPPPIVEPTGWERFLAFLRGN